MSKFRKRPIVIEAVQWSKMGDHADVVKAYQNAESGGILGPAAASDIDLGGSLLGYKVVPAIKTAKGWYIVRPGDWIIRGVQGELYPCKPDIFEQTYEPADA